VFGMHAASYAQTKRIAVAYRPSHDRR
jgi:hypothetical protein